MSETLERHREIWKRKAGLRAVYADYYRLIRAWARPGVVLEIGGGVGNLKEYLPDTFSTDVQFAPWLDAVADAQSLPFVDGALANIVMFDVLHHIEFPRRFLAEVQRALMPGGRLIVLEPAMTPLSRVVYRLFHDEPFDMQDDPLREGEPSTDRDPYAANQAYPTLLFNRDRRRLQSMFPELSVVHHEHLALWTFLLSGGFRSWSLLPGRLVPPLLALERLTMPLLGPLAALRMLGVIEKRA